MFVVLNNLKGMFHPPSFNLGLPSLPLVPKRAHYLFYFFTVSDSYCSTCVWRRAIIVISSAMSLPFVLTFLYLLLQA
jgi:hypothetical protein